MPRFQLRVEFPARDATAAHEMSQAVAMVVSCFAFHKDQWSLHTDEATLVYAGARGRLPHPPAVVDLLLAGAC